MAILENASHTTTNHCVFNDVQGNVIQNYSAEPAHAKRRIADWLSSHNFKVTQRDIFEQRAAGTGGWFLDSQEFKSWYTGESRTLWCYGMPGAGKTVLSSVAVNYLDSFLDKKAVVVCIYCNYKEHSPVPDLIASLLKQVIQDRPEASTSIKTFYEYHTSQGTRPTSEELGKAFQTEVGTSNIFVVVDALDECLECDQGYLITELQSLANTVHLMVTSRPLPLIKQLFRDATHLEIRATDEDVEIYIGYRISRSRRLALHIDRDKTLQESIVHKVTTKVGGMFLLAKLHLDSLVNHTNGRAVRTALEILPAEVNATYDIAMERITRQDEADRELAERVLSWITHAYRPLSLKELQHALSVFPGMAAIDPDSFEHEIILTSICAGLVVVDEISSVVHLVHYTAQEYFETKRASLFPHAQANIAATCLIYLSLDVFGKAYYSSGEIVRLQRENPLLDYAASYWGHYARGEVEEAITELASNFLQQELNVACASQILLTSKPFTRWSHDFSGMHLLSYFGLVKVMRCQIKNGATVDLRESSSRSPLSIAAERGHSAVVRLLLACDDVKVNSQDRTLKTPLIYAVINGHDAVVRLLLACDDVKVNFQDWTLKTPLIHAVINGHDAVVRLLLERKDLEVNLQGMFDWTPLAYAAKQGNDEVVKLLLGHKDVNANPRDHHHRTPLFYATRDRHDVVLRLLLTQIGIEVNSKDKDGETPLLHATKNGYDMAVGLFLAREDVQVNSRDNHHRTPLSWSAEMGKKKVARLLLQRNDVEINSQDKASKTPLIYTVRHGHAAIVRLLLARDDIQVNLWDKYHRTLLSYAAEGYNLKSDQEVVKLLLASKDIQVNLKDERGRTPLSYAAAKGNDWVVSPLLARKEVEVNSKDSAGHTPLWYAMINGHHTVVALIQAWKRGELGGQ